MGVTEIITIGSLILKAITFAEELFTSSGTGEKKKELVLSIAQTALVQAYPDADPAKVAEAGTVLDEFIEAGVKLLKAVSK